MTDVMAVRTRFFDDFFLDAAAAGHPAGGDPGLRPRHPRLPAALAGGHRRLRDRPAQGHRVQDPDAGRRSAPHPPPTAARSASTCATTGRRPCAQPGSTTTAPTAWIAEGLLVYLPPEAQDRLFDNITALARPAADWPPSTTRTPARASPTAPRKLSDQWQRTTGSDIDLADLFYAGERTPVVDYLHRARLAGEHPHHDRRCSPRYGRRRSPTTTRLAPLRNSLSVTATRK